MQEELSTPDPPSRHHLLFDRLTALSKAEGRRCLPAKGGQAIAPPPAYAGAGLRRIAPYASVVAPRRPASNTLLVIRDTA